MKWDPSLSLSLSDCAFKNLVQRSLVPGRYGISGFSRLEHHMYQIWSVLQSLAMTLKYAYI